MANIPLKSIQFPGLDDTYTVPSNAGELPYNKSATYPADTVGKALQNIGDSSAPAIIETATGSIASFTDGANVPVKDLVAEIVPLQSGSGDPSPSNVRAISGRTECNVEVCQKNLLTTDRTSGTFDNITYTKNEDGTVTLSGSTGASGVWVTMSTNGFYQNANELGLPIGTPCIISGGVSGNIRFGFRLRYAPSNILDVGSGVSATFTNDEQYIPAIYIAPNTTTNVTLQPMVRLSTADSTFEPYNGSTHTISFASAGTVYGGRLDVASGVLVVDRLLLTIDGTEANWNEYPTMETTAAYLKDIFINRLPLKINEDGWGICDNMKCVKNATSPSGQTAVISTATANSGRNLYVMYPSSITSLASWKTYLNSNPMHLVYILANSTTYQLTPTEVKTLLKNNNIWADTGDVAVEYVADTKTFIENLVNA